jgi:formiminotetrahydrofolate cyclodeaminase
VGTGAELLRACAIGASLNVFINAKALQDKQLAQNIEGQALTMANQSKNLADKISASVMAASNNS